MTTNTILIVDPDQKFVKTVREFLLSQGYQVSLADNGSQAIEKILSTAPLVVLLSLKLPDAQGQHLLKKINEIDPHLAVILTDTDQEASLEALSCGVIDFFSKPIDHKALLMVIQKIPHLVNLSIAGPGKEEGSSLSDFFPFLVHELRNPLQAIGGALTIIEKRSNWEDKPLAQSLRIIKEEVQYLSGFVRACLDFVSPVPNKDFCLEIDLSQLIGLCVKLITYMFKESSGDIDIITHLDPHLPKIYANYEEIKQVLLNLLKNSIEAMNQSHQKELTIKLKNKNFYGTGWVEISISDSGLGIKKEDLSHIGTPFFTTKLRGNGLGLAVCRRIIVDRHKGNMIIESDANQGTTVTVRLPVNPASENTKDRSC
jgi:nitrogen-specific signal transduction histidine kinase